jgi:phenylpropionate dioxygenase-like ring-hydroxylating dioxygenase large terminal subunit
MTSIGSGTVDEIAIRAALDDLDVGLGIPSAWYVRPDLLEQELDAIFARHWVCVGHVAEVAEPGDQVPTTAGRIPVALVRGTDGVLRAFLNACRHRAHPVAIEARNRKTLQCPYHAWTYNLDGSLRHAPRAEREPAFSCRELSLQELAVDTWGPFVFVNAASDPTPLAAQLGELPAVAEQVGVDFSRCTFRERQHAVYPGNWKNYLDNSFECYHCPTAHPGLSAVYDMSPDGYKLVAGEYWQAQLTTWKDLTSQDEARFDYQYYYLFPNFTCVIYKDRDGTLQGYAGMWFTPGGVSETLQRIDFHFADDLDQAVIAEIIDVTWRTKREDMELIRRVQATHASGLASPQRLMVQSEWLIQHFQRLVCRTLLREAAPSDETSDPPAP